MLRFELSLDGSTSALSVWWRESMGALRSVATGSPGGLCRRSMSTGASRWGAQYSACRSAISDWQNGRWAKPAQARAALRRPLSREHCHWMATAGAFESHRRSTRGVAIGPLLRAEPDGRKCTGRADVTKLRTAGPDAVTYKRNLRWRRGSAGGDGAVKGVNIAAYLRQAGAPERQTGCRGADTRQTDFSDLSAPSRLPAANRISCARHCCGWAERQRQSQHRNDRLPRGLGGGTLTSQDSSHWTVCARGDSTGRVTGVCRAEVCARCEQLVSAR